MFKNSKIQLLRDSINKVTQILVEKNIEVMQCGSKAFVERDADGNAILINLPYISDDASDQMLTAIQGFVDHEVSHVLFCDGKLSHKAKSKGKKVGDLYEYFSDAFAEKKMKEKFAGSRKNLNQLSEFNCDKRLNKRWEELTEEGANSEVKVASMISAITRAWSGDTCYEEFMHDKWSDIADVVDRFPESYIKRVKDCKSSEEALNLTEEFMQLIQVESGDGESEDETFQTSDSTSKSSKPKDEFVEAGGSEKSDDGDDADEMDEDLDDSDDAEGDADSDSDDEEENDAEETGDAGEDDSESEDDSGTKDKDEDSSEGYDSESSETKETEDAKSGSDGKDFLESLSTKDTMDDIINSEVADIPQTRNSYTIRTTELDQYLTAPTISEHNLNTRDGFYSFQHVYRDETTVLAELREASLQSVGVLSKKLEQAFLAKNKVFYQPGLRSGKINCSALFKLKTGDDRVFRKKVEIKAKNTVVSLVMDQSGSMQGAKIKNAAVALYALSEILHRLKIPFEVIGFTESPTYSPFLNGLSHVKRKAFSPSSDRSGHSRTGVLVIETYKSYSEEFNYPVKSRMGVAYEGGCPMGGNIDGESILYAARRIADRPEEKKCIIVLSDGQPASDGNTEHQEIYLKKVVEMIEKSPISIVGLGINSNAVQNYYKDNIYFKNQDEISERVIGQLAKILTDVQ